MQKVEICGVDTAGLPKLSNQESEELMKRFLVVVDMQTDFVDGALGSLEAQAIVPNVVKKITSFTGQRIIVTQDTHFENYMDTQEGQKLPVPHCIKGTDGWSLHPEVEAAIANTNIDVTRIEKVTFGSINLPETFHEFSFNEGKDLKITLIGLCTDICVISNAMILKAHYPEATIMIDAACCAGVTPESHDNALAAMQMCQMEIINKGE